ncbi:hypothetical protein O999_10980 [Pseudomonas putida LF54]|nr:hypothetical protein O999_10980 [Pseudomonas putida LF54]POF96556.1 hypothetical protein BGP81_07380 [Pseudomonas putida]
MDKCTTKAVRLARERQAMAWVRVMAVLTTMVRTIPAVTVPTAAREPAAMALVIAAQMRVVVAMAQPEVDQAQVPAVS